MDTLKSLSSAITNGIRSYPKSCLAGSAVLALLGRACALDSKRIDSMARIYDDPSSSEPLILPARISINRPELWTGRALTALGIVGIVVTVASLQTVQTYTAKAVALVKGVKVGFYTKVALAVSGALTVTSALAMQLSRTRENHALQRSYEEIGDPDWKVVREILGYGYFKREVCLRGLQARTINFPDHQVEPTIKAVRIELTRRHWNLGYRIAQVLTAIGVLGVISSLAYAAFQLRSTSKTPSLPVDGRPATTPVVPLEKPATTPAVPLNKPAVPLVQPEQKTGHWAPRY